MNYLSAVNSLYLYLIVALVLLFIIGLSTVFLVKSYRAGIAIGMDKKVLHKAITSSALFTILPSVSILLGVIALSGTLGVPLPWLRLSVIGALQYELNVAEIAATSIGLTGLKVSEMTVGAFVTIALVMTAGILSSVLCCIFGLKKYLSKLGTKVNGGADGKPGFGSWATVAMFIGLCSTYIASYIGIFVVQKNFMPLFVALVSAAVMGLFEYLIQKKHIAVLENFDVATSMLVGMVAAVLVGLI